MDDKLLAALIGGAVSLVVTGLGLIFNPLAQRRLQAEKGEIDAHLATRKAEVDRELQDRRGEIDERLDELRARLDEGAAERAAQREYEFEARKRLYTQVEPLMLQVGFAAENAFDRVANLALTTRKGFLDPGPNSWLEPGDEGRRYYLDSTIYRLLLPVAFFEILRGKTTHLDFKLDPRLDAAFRLLRQQFRLWSEEFKFAGAAPALDYEPYARRTREEEVATPARYYRQGVALGRVDKIAAAMVLTADGEIRVKRLGEFESECASGQGALHEAAGPFYALFKGFRPDVRPVLWRILCAQACLAYTVRRLVSGAAGGRDVTAIVEQFCGSPRTHELFSLAREGAPAGPPDATVFAAVRVVLKRLLSDRDPLDPGGDALPAPESLSVPR
jgi:hypothetical protein